MTSERRNRNPEQSDHDLGTPEKLLRVNVVAQRLGVHPKTVRSYYRSGKLKYRRTQTGRIRIPESAVEDFLGAGS